ncbi:hypothetical protein B0J17DRAFT_370552 [Rhizoctonia solani]|nr:hypothetical protein B0J17DRAFT_370552 [Rhizoctonia solani]
MANMTARNVGFGCCRVFSISGWKVTAVTDTTHGILKSTVTLSLMVMLVQGLILVWLWTYDFLDARQWKRKAMSSSLESIPTSTGCLKQLSMLRDSKRMLNRMSGKTFLYLVAEAIFTKWSSMMLAMCEAAKHLGSYLPDSNPQFMQPGLALHITGTTRLGKTEEGQKPDKTKSVANEFSQVHGHNDLFVGGGGIMLFQIRRLAIPHVQA